MKKRMIALVVLAALALTLLAACGKKDAAISTEEAQKIALQEIGLKTAHHIHVDAQPYEGTPCFVVHISEGGQEYYVYVSQTGEVLHTEK